MIRHWLKCSISAFNLDGRTASPITSIKGEDIVSKEDLKKHAAWVEEIKGKYTDINKGNVMDILKEEIGQVFVKVLEDAGVYKYNEEGRKAFDRFIAVL